MTAITPVGPNIQNFEVPGDIAVISPNPNFQVPGVIKPQNSIFIKPQKSGVITRFITDLHQNWCGKGVSKKLTKP